MGADVAVEKGSEAVFIRVDGSDTDKEDMVDIGAAVNVLVVGTVLADISVFTGAGAGAEMGNDVVVEPADGLEYSGELDKVVEVGTDVDPRDETGSELDVAVETNTKGCSGAKAGS